MAIFVSCVMQGRVDDDGLQKQIEETSCEGDTSHKATSDDDAGKEHATVHAREASDHPSTSQQVGGRGQRSSLANMLARPESGLA